jgi:ABC-type multidrug transport system permease subunit
MRAPKFSQRHAPALFAIMMSLLMTVILTCFVTFVNTGSGNGFVARWLHAFLLAWPVAFMCILLFARHVRRIVARVTAP